MNKTLKDLVIRTRQMMGFDADYIPGWDCHGLPIEWKVEEEYRAAGKQKRDVPTAEFRKACRDYAQKWIDIQRSEFKRLGGIGNWNDSEGRDERTAQARRQARDVEPGGADRTRRGGDRVRRPQGADDLGQVFGGLAGHN
jgi:isoleucyl-tRNA synthetase